MPKLTRKEIENLSSESLSDLERLAEGLGYDYLGRMLQDNPGMVEAIYNFVLDNLSSYGIEDD